jgi:hypothetical protein
MLLPLGAACWMAYLAGRHTRWGWLAGLLVGLGLAAWSLHGLGDSMAAVAQQHLRAEDVAAIHHSMWIWPVITAGLWLAGGLLGGVLASLSLRKHPEPAATGDPPEPMDAQ